VQFDAGGLKVLGDCRQIFRRLTDLSTSPPVRAMHVTKVNWKNDDVQIFPSQFEFDPAGNKITKETLEITFDLPPDPISLTPATVIVTMEIPFLTATGIPAPAGSPPTPLISSILEGTVSISGSSIQWRPSPDSLAKIKLAFSEHAESFGSGALVRVTLKGFAIWSSQGNDRAYLHGQSLGLPAEGSVQRGGSRTDLALPSQSSASPSDFEGWFWVANPVALKSFTISPDGIDIDGTHSGTGVGTITLTAPAPPNGAVITLTSSSPLATLQNTSVSILAGLTTATFKVDVHAKPVPKFEKVFVEIIATLDGKDISEKLTVNLV
jgi:hypothetical protein